MEVKFPWTFSLLPTGGFFSLKEGLARACKSHALGSHRTTVASTSDGTLTDFLKTRKHLAHVLLQPQKKLFSFSRLSPPPPLIKPQFY